MGINITSVVRYAIQIITDYGTENIKPDLKFESIKWNIWKISDC